MLISESIYFIVMFTLPATMHIIYNTYLRDVPRNKPNKSVELAESVFFCVIVFVCNIAILNLSIFNFTNYILMSEADKIVSNFYYMGFIIIYTIINFLTSFGIIFFWYKNGKRLFKRIVHKINKSEDIEEELEFPDVWRNIFESKKFINVFDSCIVIEQNSTLITAGFLQASQEPNSDSRELLLYNTEKVREILKRDEQESPDNKIFYPAINEYYDGKSGLLYKFYDLTKYREKHPLTQRKY